MRTELDVPFSHKEEAKALGAKWDRTKKIWYVPSGVNPEPFAEWLPGVDRSDPSAPYIYPPYIYLVLGKRECWKCHKETSVAAFGIPYRTDNDESIVIAHAPNKAGHIAIDTANANALAIVPALGCVPGEIRDYLHKRCGYKPVGARASKARRSATRAPVATRCKAAAICSRSPRPRLPSPPSTSCRHWSLCASKLPASLASRPRAPTLTRRSLLGHATITPSSTGNSVRGFICRDRRCLHSQLLRITYPSSQTSYTISRPQTGHFSGYTGI